MNATMEISTRGTRNRAKPSNRPVTGVVAAKTMDADAPMSALAAMLNAAHRPSVDNDTPSTSVCSPPPTKGTSTAMVMNGKITAQRANHTRIGMRATMMSVSTQANATANTSTR